MSAREAHSFSRYSAANSTKVKAVLKCGCEPYRDVFTYNRWLAQGFQVQRGERAIALPVIVQRVDEEDEAKTHKAFRTARVFCRHQVKGQHAEQERPPTQAIAPISNPSPENTAMDNEPTGLVASAMGTWKEL